jgi:hypothetical protein
VQNPEPDLRRAILTSSNTGTFGEPVFLSLLPVLQPRGEYTVYGDCCGDSTGGSGIVWRRW